VLRKDAAKKRQKRTIEEEERGLAATPAGKGTGSNISKKAEELYLRR